MESEAVRVGLDCGESACVGDVVRDRYRGCMPPAAGHTGVRPNSIVHEERRNAGLPGKACDLAVGVINDGATVIRLGQVEFFEVSVIRVLAVDAVYVEQRGGVKSGTAKNPAPRVWIPEVKAPGHLAGRVVAVTVELITIGEQMAEVCEQLEVVVDSRRSPNPAPCRADSYCPR